MVAKINGFFSMHMPYSDKGNDTSWVTCGDNGQAVMYYLFNDKSNLLGIPSTHYWLRHIR